MFNENRLQQIRDRLIARSESVAVAESVTAGLVQCALSQAKDASCFFQGGITAYNLGQKARHLQVDPVHASACDCVSEKVSAQMARAVAGNFSADWGISVTGYAASTKEIPEPYAIYSISYRGELKDTGRIESTQEGWLSQKHYVTVILEQFAMLL